VSFQVGNSGIVIAASFGNERAGHLTDRSGNRDAIVYELDVDSEVVEGVVD